MAMRMTKLKKPSKASLSEPNEDGYRHIHGLTLNLNGQPVFLLEGKVCMHEQSEIIRTTLTCDNGLDVYHIAVRVCKNCGLQLPVDQQGNLIQHEMILGNRDRRAHIKKTSNDNDDAVHDDDGDACTKYDEQTPQDDVPDPDGSSQRER